MMYQIGLYCDDEAFSRGLANGISWEALGFSLCEIFSNCDDAQSYIKTHAPDALLCAVDCENQKIAKYVFDNNISTAIMIIQTGCSFGDLRMALRYRVADYIVKPLNIQEMTYRLTVLKNRLDLEHIRKGYGDRLLSTLLFLYESQSAQDNGQREMVHLLPVTITGDSPSPKAFSRIVEGILREKMGNDPALYPRGDNEFLLCVRSSEDGETVTDTVTRALPLARGAFGFSVQIVGPTVTMPRSSPSLLPDSSPCPPIDIVSQSIAYISEHLADKLSINSVSAFVHVNPSYLSRRFKQVKGVTFTDWILQSRIERAKMLLSQSNRYVYEICEQVGIQNYQYFYICFRKSTGLSPSEYRLSRNSGAPQAHDDPAESKEKGNHENH